MNDSQKLQKILETAVNEFEDIQAAQRDERMQCLDDRRFYSIAGAQWEGKLGDQFENKPKLEINKLHLAVIRIINEYRNNRIAITFTPKDGESNNKLSDACNGLYRADECASMAEEAYDNAFEEAVGGGIGAWRYRAEYEDDEDDDNEQQKICIEPIFDADSCVFFDLNSKRQDKSDATKCWVMTPMSRTAYTETYDDDPESWPKSITKSEYDWCTPDYVNICEHYIVEKVSGKLLTYTGIAGDSEKILAGDLEDDPERRDMLKATGYKKTGEKNIKRTKVHKYILSRGKILEDCGYIAGKHIPIVMTYGKRWYVDGVERCMGHVRLGRDAQMIKNMQMSKLAEISALSSVEKPILDPEEIANHQLMWQEDNIKNYPYLLKNRATDMNGTPILAPMEYTRAPNIPPAMAALLQIVDADMQELMGNQQAGEELQSNLSGVAVELVQNKLDMQSFIYMSNMAKAQKRGGEIWLSMAKELFIENNRKMKTIGKQGDVGSIELMRPVMSKEDQSVEYENDLSEANFDVNVEIGPTSSSRRGSTVRALTQMMQITQDPETLQVLGSMAMMNMEGEGIDDVRDYFRNKLIHMGVVKPSEEEMAELAKEQENAKPDANSEYLEASARAADAMAAKDRAQTILTVAKADESRASTEKIMSEIDHSKQDQIIKTVDALHNHVQGFDTTQKP